MEQISENNDKIKEFAQKFNDLLQEYSVRPEIKLNFPDYKNLPNEVQLALLVIDKHKNEFVLNFKEIK